MTKYYVYSITINNTIVYIGYTNDLDVRELQHLNFCYNSKHKQYNKELYIYIRSLFATKEEAKKNIFLIPLGQFDTAADAKRFECFMILSDYFNDKTLLQSIPKISDKRW